MERVLWAGRCLAAAVGADPGLLRCPREELGQGLGLRPLKAHYSFFPQPAALQHRPAWLSARGTGGWGWLRKTPTLPVSSLQRTLGQLQACKAKITPREA